MRQITPVVALIPLLCACSSSSGTPTTMQPSTSTSSSHHRKSSDSLDFQACSSSFATGPIWASIEDKEVAFAEARWVATIGIQQSASTVALETSMRKLAASGVTVLQNHDNQWLLVAGRPASILSNLQASCEWVSFDLTGFHCECAPEQCLRAMTCDLKAARFSRNKLVMEALSAIQYVTPSYQPVVGCLQDLNLEGGSVLHETQIAFDFRGVGWILGPPGSVMRSWETSSCARPEPQTSESTF